MARRVNGPGLLTMVAFLGLWEAAVRGGMLEFQYLPAPSAIGRGIGTVISSGELATSTLHTLRVTLLGWLLASLLAPASASCSACRTPHGATPWPASRWCVPSRR